MIHTRTPFNAFLQKDWILLVLRFLQFIDNKNQSFKTSWKLLQAVINNDDDSNNVSYVHAKYNI
jgi:hypothetical protein